MSTHAELADLPLEHFAELGVLDQPVHDIVGSAEVEVLPGQVVGRGDLGAWAVPLPPLYFP